MYTSVINMIKQRAVKMTSRLVCYATYIFKSDN